MANLTREEEQRGWRRTFLWMIPAALVIGVALLFVPTLMNRLTDQRERGMDTITNQEPPAADKQALGPANIEVKATARFGEYLTDGSGRPLYLFKADTRGAQGRAAESDCYDDCAKSWPPLLTSGQSAAVPPAETALLGTLARKDGSIQVTYDGWPLYRYVRDVGPGPATGHDIEDFGEEWYLVAPSGDEVKANADTGSGS